jgi:hypothetical protein
LLIYEDHPQAASWLKWFLIGVLALTLILGVVFLNVDKVASITMFAVTLFDGILFYCIVPRSYQIYEDCIRINLGGPFKMRLSFKDIRSISRVDGSKALASSNIRFATSTNFVVEITRKGKMGVEISPANGEIFMEQVNQAWKRYTAISPR